MTAFDLVVVAGEKDRARSLAVGVAAERIRDIGYVKLDYLARMGTTAPRLFANDRPVVLYNPHFDPAISSLDMARAVIAAFAGQDRYNLVYAPHVRATEDLSPAAQAEWMALAIPDRIIVDLGSPRLFDMTYTRAADLYLGDMSSQLYEFMARPRPVVFLDAHDTAWRDDPRHAAWRLGVVTDTVAGVLPAIDRAFAEHPAMVDRQRAAVARAFGDYHGAIRRGAAVVAEAMRLPPCRLD